MTLLSAGDLLESPLGRYLLDPGGAIRGWLIDAWSTMRPWAELGLKVLAALAIFLGAVALLVSLRRRSASKGAARWMSILLPPEVDPTGASALWLNLVELLRPPWRRLLDGQPHLAFEYLWSVDGLRIGIWVPEAVPPDLVERAVEAAWPGSQVVLFEPPEPLGGSGTVLAGELRLEAAEHFPLRTDHSSDPLRALLGAAGGVRPGESTAVQVLARPVGGGRLARCYQAARTRRSGRSADRWTG